MRKTPTTNGYDTSDTLHPTTLEHAEVTDRPQKSLAEVLAESEELLERVNQGEPIGVLPVIQVVRKTCAVMPDKEQISRQYQRIKQALRESYEAALQCLQLLEAPEGAVDPNEIPAAQDLQRILRADYEEKMQEVVRLEEEMLRLRSETDRQQSILASIAMAMEMDTNAQNAE